MLEVTFRQFSEMFVKEHLKKEVICEISILGSRGSLKPLTGTTVTNNKILN